MQSLLSYLIKQIVDLPDDVSIEESVKDDRTLLIIHANQADLGKIIGKNGRIIKAIRDLVKVVAAKHSVYADVVLAE